MSHLGRDLPLRCRVRALHISDVRIGRVGVVEMQVTWAELSVVEGGGVTFLESWDLKGKKIAINCEELLDNGTFQLEEGAVVWAPFS